MSNILNEIKLLLIHNEMTMTELLENLNKEYGRTEASSNFHRKLSKETIRYSEVKEIAEVLGYHLAWIPEDVRIESTDNQRIFYSTKPSEIKHKQKGKPINRLRKDNYFDGTVVFTTGYGKSKVVAEQIESYSPNNEASKE